MKSTANAKPKSPILAITLFFAASKKSSTLGDLRSLCRILKRCRYCSASHICRMISSFHLTWSLSSSRLSILASFTFCAFAASSGVVWRYRYSDKEHRASSITNKPCGKHTPSTFSTWAWSENCIKRASLVMVRISFCDKVAKFKTCLIATGWLLYFPFQTTEKAPCPSLSEILF